MTTNVAMRHVLLYPSDGLWVAEVPSLPGTMSQGTTREEAIANIREAIELMLEVLREHSDLIPDDALMQYWWLSDAIVTTHLSCRPSLARVLGSSRHRRRPRRS